MAQNDNIQLFDDKRIRTAWDEEKEEWYFSIIDAVAVLTNQPDYQAARNYWKVTKKRLKEEGNETVTACNQLKMTAADGKRRMTDVANTEQLLRIIQSIPSPKAEPFKLWLAEATTTEISKQKAPSTFSENIAVAREGGEAAGIARKAVEARTGVPVITSKNAAQLNQVVASVLENSITETPDPSKKQ